VSRNNSLNVFFIVLRMWVFESITLDVCSAEEKKMLENLMEQLQTNFILIQERYRLQPPFVDVFMGSFV
jgi:hypothetical protein